MTKARVIPISIVVLVAALLAGAFYAGAIRPTTFEARPPGIMNTETRITVTARRIDARKAQAVLRRAEKALRDIEVRMSATIDLSELSRLNRAKKGESVKLSGQTLEVLRASRKLAEQTQGAFDVTCGPLLALWKEAGQKKRLPTKEQIDRALADGGWRHFALEEGGAQRLHERASIGLGGIAKGYGVDRAIEALGGDGVLGGLVDLGGHIRSFGRPIGGGRWRIDVRDPFYTDGVLCKLAMAEAIICTSGNYVRFAEIGGKRYSHIVDPRTGWPVDFAPSVTVTGPTTMLADGWATALSVLGPAGLRRVGGRTGIEALVIVGGPDNWKWYATEGFEKLLIEPLPAWRRGQMPPATRPAG